MNKVDLLVKRMMLAYPTLYPNRFMALAEAFTNSCFYWDANGCIVDQDAFDVVSPDEMVATRTAELNKQNERINSPTRHECFKSLDERYLAETEAELLMLRHVAKNIDIYASEFTGVDYNTIQNWLFNLERRGISEYWVINNKPDVVDEEWRVAIREWLQQIIPTVNSNYGIYDNAKNKWGPIDRYAKTFNWMYDTFYSYETESDRKANEHAAELVAQVLKELKEEENV